jgi:CubicO group peptidase (beta-lactamase class C family)
VHALGAALVLVLPATCDSATGPPDGYPIPAPTGDGWQTASLESVGMDPGPLQDLVELISNTDNHLIHSILIVKDQRLVFEEYWSGSDMESISLNLVEKDFDRETLHYVASVSKSITKNEDNGQLTVEHLLTFSSGYAWNEHEYGFDDPRDSHFRMFNSPDPVRFLLRRPLVLTPGSEFHYNSGDTNLLGEVVRRTSGATNLVEFADRHLFQPLGIDQYQWARFPLADQMTFASGGAFLRHRDMAKLGALYLNGGSWNGVQVVSPQWVDASTEMSTPLVGEYRTLYGYGYNWWLGRSQSGTRKVAYFRASGWGGQNVYVFPELEMVLVFTAGGYYDTRPLNVNDLIEHHIFQAIVE